MVSATSRVELSIGFAPGSASIGPAAGAKWRFSVSGRVFCDGCNKAKKTLRCIYQPVNMVTVSGSGVMRNFKRGGGGRA